jgi:peptidyl-dipeptidase A
VSAAREARAFVERVTAAFAPLEREANDAAWEAAIGGGEAASERAARARTELRALFSDPRDAARVRAWLADGALEDALLGRQLELLDLELRRNQLPHATLQRLVDRQSELERIFYAFRSEIDGERVSNNRILEILHEERDGARREAAWRASKQIGAEVAGPLRALARERNEAARALGFRDAYRMDLELQEIDEDRLLETLGRFEALTEAPFRRFREGQDRELAERFGVAPDALRPWHWPDPFGQEAPAAGTLNLDAYFADADLERVAREFFAGIGLPVDAILARSDLYEREGKDQHAFCQDMDREGDIRILCNLRPNEKWMMVLLHELGHAVYDDQIPRALPYLLRYPAHILSTESVAMYFGRLSREPAWLRDAADAPVGADEERAIRDALRASMLVATRWMLVMVHFERALYADPERPDLNRVWWDLVERMQRIRYPEADREGTEWATKIHLSLSPVYYHNYLLGELMASQVSAAIRRETGIGGDRSVHGEPRVGAFFRERVFGPGASVDWNGLLVHATGEPLDARFFVEEFVGA